MNVLLAVIDDLWQFAYQTVFGFKSVNLVKTSENNQPALPLTPKINSPKNNDLVLIRERVEEYQFRAGEQYYVGELETYLYSDPVIAFDTALTKVSYGQMVYVKKLGGRWAHVTVSGQSGWLLKDVLREKREDIHPHFKNETYYAADNKETIKLRACIGDEFGCARANIPLTPAEFVFYKLLENKRLITWQVEGPRLPGTWQRRLKGQKGIHMSISPVTGSVMEYIIDDIGYLAYVEAVFPDKSIKVLQVGVPEEGQYSERIIDKENYIELRPVFIEVVNV